MDKNFKKIIKIAKENKKVVAVALFGSSLKKNGRDIDLCIFLDKKYPNLDMSKERMVFLRESGDNFDIQIFQQLPLYIRIRIIKDSKILYCSKIDSLYDIFINTINEFGFYKKIYDLYLKEVKDG